MDTEELLAVQKVTILENRRQVANPSKDHVTSHRRQQHHHKATIDAAGARPQLKSFAVQLTSSYTEPLDHWAISPFLILLEGRDLERTAVLICSFTYRSFNVNKCYCC